ncbi:MAG: hypothetical protein M1308_00335 [Actinobacteria bacterium]|nr:hypothetical protein [Actinomycetota bacterium]
MEKTKENINGIDSIPFLDGISLHYYTVPFGWGKKLPVTNYEEDQWFATLKYALSIEEMILRSSEVLDKYDSNKRIGLIIDEWGIWYDTEFKRNIDPKYIFNQQNTLCDAVVTASTFNIFNNHCDRVKMTNIAQLVNILQSLFITEEEKIVLTPTYYVFKMYKEHQNNTLLPIKVTCKEYKFQDMKIPQINASASKSSSGEINITVCNTNPKSSAIVDCRVNEHKINCASGKIISASDMDAHNTFEKPDVIKIADFNSFQYGETNLTIKLPPMSIVSLNIG